ncbi:MAG TPA: hypothetical protein VET23_03120, partial [Chitinophagaceae bacterium]|nr:hypothetical protein [Chitinophagaceae bacterium]
TRLKARMEREHGPINKYNWIFRPVYILSTLVVILAVNVVIIFHTNTEDTDVTKTEKESIQSISSVYNLNYNFIYDTN